MATLPAVGGHTTLVDWAKRLDPDGSVPVLAELLNQTNEIIYDMNWIEGNLPTGHKSIVRTALPAVQTRAFYEGVAVTKSLTATVEDVATTVEGRNEIDKDLADLNGNAAAYRLSEGVAFTESMNQSFAKQIFYGDTSKVKKEITGLTPRFNSLSASETKNNIIDAGGSGADNSSVWLVVWAPQAITGFYPKGSKAGLVQEDLGVIDAFDANNARYRAYAERWQWKFGLTVKDWRYAVRIANVDVSDLKGMTGTQATTDTAHYLPYLMAEAMQHIPSIGMGRAAFYAPRTVKGMLAVLAMQKSSGFMTFSQAGEQFGKITPGYAAGQGTGISGGNIEFLGVPVRTVDQLLLTEARVV